MSFTTKNLTGERVLVKGTDIEGGAGEVIVNATQWNELKAREDLKTAGEEFDAAVEAFYAPLLKAAEAANKALERPEDSLSFVVLDEGSEGEARRPQHVVRLSRDSMILRLIEQGNTDRLIWAGGELEILEVLPGTHQSPADVQHERLVEAQRRDDDQDEDPTQTVEGRGFSG